MHRIELSIKTRSLVSSVMFAHSYRVVFACSREDADKNVIGTSDWIVDRIFRNDICDAPVQCAQRGRRLQCTTKWKTQHWEPVAAGCKKSQYYWQLWESLCLRFSTIFVFHCCCCLLCFSTDIRCFSLLFTLAQPVSHRRPSINSLLTLNEGRRVFLCSEVKQLKRSVIEWKKER